MTRSSPITHKVSRGIFFGVHGECESSGRFCSVWRGKSRGQRPERNKEEEDEYVMPHHFCSFASNTFVAVEERRRSRRRSRRREKVIDLALVWEVRKRYLSLQQTITRSAPIADIFETRKPPAGRERKVKRKRSFLVYLAAGAR